jgi:lysophospholipase L1-like esterase
VVLAGELALRALSLHRTLVYERQGDLLFTPVPGQVYVEKISLTPSRINEWGLRGAPVVGGGRRQVLCLGDSITYGYGVADGATYPGQLQVALDRFAPGRFEVLNGGVNAYPVSFMHQKFLYLWGRGLRPDVVVVGYSLNEGWLGHLVASDATTKQAFARRVRLKNVLRQIALYNVVIENWARAYYDRLKTRLVPGTHVTRLEETDWRADYDRTLDAMLTDLTARRVSVVFLALAALNGQTGRYETEGPLQQRFVEFAMRRRVPLLRADQLLRAAADGSPAIDRYFIDYGHMNPQGLGVIAAGLAAWLMQEAPAPRQ